MDREELDLLARHPQIQKGWHTRSNGQRLPSGFESLDEVLEGGWPVGVLCEVLPDSPGIGELSLFLPAMAELSNSISDDSTGISLIAPPWVPYAPGFQQAGVCLSRLLVVQASNGLDSLWAMEQALSSRSCRACFAWIDKASDLALRRLQLAAADAGSWAVIFRSPGFQDCASPAALRLRLSRNSHGLIVHLLRCRGSRPARVLLNVQ